MEHREHERMSAVLQARIFYGNTVYTGTVSNLSERGMFINTCVNFPVDSVFDAVVLQNGHTLTIPVKVKRAAKTDDRDAAVDDKGIGVKIIAPPQNYLELLGKCKSEGAVHG